MTTRSARFRVAAVALLSLGAAHTSLHAAKVSGRFLYADKTFTFNDGFTGAMPTLPVRKAVVEAIDVSSGSALLGITSTNDDGTFTLNLSGSGPVNLVVRCYSRSQAFFSLLRVTNLSNVQYSVSSATYPSWSMTSDLNVGTIVAQQVTSSGSGGNPFNMLDQMVASLEYLKSIGAPNPPYSLTMVWPAGGSFASGSMANIDADDGYDDLVQLHEFAHVLHTAYSDSDSPGGGHTFGQSDQDPRLAFTEGWASWFGGAVRRHQGLTDPGYYLDCYAGSIGQVSIQLRLRFEDGYPYATAIGGVADEAAVATALWDVIDDKLTVDGSPGVDDDLLDGTVVFAQGKTGGETLWSSFVGPVKQAADATLADLWLGMFAGGLSQPLAQLEAVFAGWKQRFYRDAAEPDDNASTASMLPLQDQWSDVRTLYTPAGAGDVDWYVIPVTVGTKFDVMTRYPFGVIDAETYVDPYLRLLRPDGSQFAAADDGGFGRNARIIATADQSGGWLVEVSSKHPFRRMGSYQVRATMITPPSGCVNLPTVKSVGVSKPGVGGAPKLTAITQPVVPGQFTVRVTGGPANQKGWVLFSQQAIDVPFDLGHVYVAPDYVQPFTTDAAGKADITHPAPSTALCGQVGHLQAFFFQDPGAAGAYQTSHTPRLTFVYGG